MKKLAVLIALFLVLVTAGLALASDPVKVIIITGQSNAGQRGEDKYLPAAARSAQVPNALYYAPQHSGTSIVPMRPYKGLFGVELPLADSLSRACPESEFLYVKRYSGGTSIIAWDPNAPQRAGWRTDMSAVDNSTKPAMYPLVRKTLADATAKLGRPVQVVGIVYVQIERDSKYGYGAIRYRDNLTNLIAAWRSLYGPVPVVFIGAHTNIRSYGPVAQAAAEAVASTVPGTALMQVDDLPKVDLAHFRGDGLLTLGGRMAEALVANGVCD